MNKSRSNSRLNEIVKVLKQYNITKGMDPIKLRHILEDLGPTYAKLGQVMSMRSDMLPEVYCKELAKLQAEVKPLPFSDILVIIEKELGDVYPAFFQSIEEKPVGSASIAQVHRATLKSGEQVVIKVQRPGIREKMEEDIILMHKAVGLLKLYAGTRNLIDFNALIDELWKITQEEINFIKEANNYEIFAENHKEIAYVICPTVVEALTTKKMIVMTYLTGTPIDQTQQLKSFGYDMNEIGEKIAESYCKQILDDGFFHADPHPGNIRVGDGKIIWLDMGMMGQLSDDIKKLMKKAVLAILGNDIYELEKVLLSIGEPKEKINHARLYSDIDEIVNKYIGMSLGNMHLGGLIERLLDLVKEHNIAVPTDVTLLGRGIITMESLLTVCSPNVNFLEIFSNHASSSLLKNIDIRNEIKHTGRDIYGLWRTAFNIPLQLSELLKLIKTGHLKVNLDINDAKEPMNNLLIIIHCLVIGIIDAGLFIASAILCTINRPPYFAGIPTIAVGGFFISFLLLVYLLIKTGKRKK